MKTLNLSWLSLLFFFLIPSIDSNACIETHPDSIWVNVIGDSLCNREIQVSNLRLAGGQANEFCSCGITSFLDGHSVEWVIFVDSLTLEAVEGFDTFSYSGAATDGWADLDANNFDWNGFVSNVNSAGLFQDQAVIMIIRTSPDPELSCDPNYFIQSEALFNWGFGTDAFDPVADELADHHQDMTFIWEFEYVGYSYEIVDVEHFNQLDEWYNSTLTSLDETRATPIKIEIYPIPADETVSVQLHSMDFNYVQLMDLTGKVFDRIRIVNPLIQIDVSDLPTGIYFMELIGNNIKQVRKISVN